MTKNTHESVLIGRATEEAVAQQGEQLDHAERLADATQATLHQANRVLKGMTWGGWVSNLLTPEPKKNNTNRTTTTTSATTEHHNTNEPIISTHDYDTLPAAVRPAAQSLRNYHANIIGVLAACETDEQRVTCTDVCNTMYAACQRQVQALPTTVPQTTTRLQRDLAAMRKRQLALQMSSMMAATTTSTTAITTAPATSANNNDDDDARKASLFGRPPESNTLTNTTTSTTAPKKPTTDTNPLTSAQDQHLTVLAASLGDMGALAHTLHQGLMEQHDRLDRLDTKSETVVEYSQQVGRRTDRMLQRKAWTKAKPPVLWSANTSIQHTPTGRYLTILDNAAWLVQQRHPLHASFRVYTIPGTNQMVGLQCEGSRKWLGQGLLLGQLTCTATSLGRREQWQLDAGSISNSTSTDQQQQDQEQDQPQITTRLLCASAGWGQGGYLQVSAETWAVSIGGVALTESRAAAQWTLTFLDDAKAASSNNKKA